MSEVLKKDLFEIIFVMGVPKKHEYDFVSPPYIVGSLKLCLDMLNSMQKESAETSIEKII